MPTLSPFRSLEQFVVVLLLLFRLGPGQSLGISVAVFVRAGSGALGQQPARPGLQQELFRAIIEFFGMDVQGNSVGTKIGKRPVSLVGRNVSGRIKDVRVLPKAKDAPGGRLQEPLGVAAAPGSGRFLAITVVFDIVTGDGFHFQDVRSKDKMKGGRRSRRPQGRNPSHGRLLGVGKVSVFQKDQGRHDADTQETPRNADHFQARNQFAQWRPIVDSNIKDGVFGGVLVVGGRRRKPQRGG